MLQEQIKNTIENKKLIKKGDKVLICVSGGPDSIALLHLMLGFKKYYHIELAIAHLDHMLRGKESTADANFVKKIAKDLNIPVLIEKRNVKKIARSSKMSLEEAAREVRYSFYKRAAEKMGANKIATGHNMDDQAETVLMRLIKGSGSRGLSGIPYKRKLKDKWVIRPLLDVKRKDIEKYLKKHGLPSRTDITNLKTFHLRNKLRHLLIPILEKEFNPKIKENLILSAQNISDEFNYLEAVARRLCRRFASGTKTQVKINIHDLSRRHVALQRLIVREIILLLKGDLRKITYKHWQEIKKLMSSHDMSSIDLPAKIKVKKKEDSLIFSKGDAREKQTLSLKKSIKLNIPGQAVVPGLGIRFSSEVVKSAPIFKKGKRRKRIEYISGDVLKSPLKIRMRQKGDRMRPLGMSAYKKLHDIFIDEKVPQETRDRIPLVLSGNKILWVVGIKLSEDFKVSTDTERIVKLAATPL